MHPYRNPKTKTTAAMQPYRIAYTEGNGETETQTYTVRAHSTDHAMDRFWNNHHAFGGSEGVRILSVKATT